MFTKRMISVLLILSLVLSSVSVVYGLEGEPQGSEITTEDGISNGDENITSGEAIEENPTDDAVITESIPQRQMSVLAVVENYFVQQMSTAGVLTKIGSGYGTLAEANAAMKSNGSKGIVVTDKAGKVINMLNGMAYYKASSTSVELGYPGNTYITKNDAMHFYSGDGINATVRISGVEAKVAVSSLILVPETLVYPNTSSFYKKDYYMKNSSGDLVHYTYSVATPSTSTPYKSGVGKTNSDSGYVVDKAPSWMTSTGTQYYSWDGINFYSDANMKTKVGSPFYSYYKYLPYRSTTAFTAAQLNTWIKSKTTTGKLLNQGSAFINAQNKYGVNAVTELAFACLESGYGKSSYALNRNNLFGINAVDTNPSLAYTFPSVADCVNEHAFRYMSKAYGDAKTDGRYFGLNAGNKAEGVNVKYASDPWHGEKIGGLAYSIDKYLGGKDYKKYSIGITKNKSVNVYKSAGSTYLYNLSTKSTGNGPVGIPVIILGTSGDYYKIQGDMAVSGSTANCAYIYNFSSSVAYVKKSDITKVNTGTVTNISVPTTPAPAPAPVSTFKFGVYNSKTKLWNKSKKGKRTTVRRTMKVSTKVKTNSKKTTVKMVIYNKNKKVVAQKVQYIYKTKTVNFSWNGKYTYHNKLKKKAGRYATYSKKGTKYYVRFIASRSGTKTHYGKYHTFYLYK